MTIFFEIQTEAFLVMITSHKIFNSRNTQQCIGGLTNSESLLGKRIKIRTGISAENM